MLKREEIVRKLRPIKNNEAHAALEIAPALNELGVPAKRMRIQTEGIARSLIQQTSPISRVQAESARFQRLKPEEQRRLGLLSVLSQVVTMAAAGDMNVFRSVRTNRITEFERANVEICADEAFMMTQAMDDLDADLYVPLPYMVRRKDGSIPVGRLLGIGITPLETKETVRPYLILRNVMTHQLASPPDMQDARLYTSIPEPTTSETA